MADKGILSRGRSCRGIRGGVLKKLQSFEKIGEESELSPLAAKLFKVRKHGVDNGKRFGQGHIDEREVQTKGPDHCELAFVSGQEEAPADADSPGKIVIYTTSMKAVRETYSDCIKITRLFQTLRVKFTIKDILLHPGYLEELQERVQDESITVPQVFINGTHIGDAEIVLDMNECGELGPWLEKFQREYVADCSECGGRGFITCLQCQGNKKGRRGTFAVLRCTVCNQHGLQPCPACGADETKPHIAVEIASLTNLSTDQTPKTTMANEKVTSTKDSQIPQEKSSCNGLKTSPRRSAAQDSEQKLVSDSDHALGSNCTVEGITQHGEQEDGTSQLLPPAQFQDNTQGNREKHEEVLSQREKMVSEKDDEVEETTTAPCQDVEQSQHTEEGDPSNKVTEDKDDIKENEPNTDEMSFI